MSKRSSIQISTMKVGCNLKVMMATQQSRFNAQGKLSYGNPVNGLVSAVPDSTNSGEGSSQWQVRNYSQTCACDLTVFTGHTAITTMGPECGK